MRGRFEDRSENDRESEKKTITEDNNNNNNNNASLNNDCDDFESESKRGAPSSTGTGVRGEGFRKVIFDFNKAREQSYSMERTNSKKKKQTVVEVEEPLVEFLGVGVQDASKPPKQMARWRSRERWDDLWRPV